MGLFPKQHQHEWEFLVVAIGSIEGVIVNIPMFVLLKLLPKLMNHTLTPAVDVSELRINKHLNCLCSRGVL